jgi:LemA protein
VISSLVLWGGLALVFFWAVGAYNRLVRLRAQISQAFAALDVLLVRQLVWVQGSLPPALRGDLRDEPAASDDPVDAAWSGLRAASDQFATTLATARARPMDPGAVAALMAAQDVLNMTWQRLWRLAIDPARAPLPELLNQEHEKLLSQTLPLGEAFNAAVMAYNGAIRQFPALLLARLFGFRPAGWLQPAEPAP